MAGKGAAARKPVLNDMSESDTAAFEAMRDDAPAAAEPEPQAEPVAEPVEPAAEAAEPTEPVAPEPVAEKTVPLNELLLERDRRRLADDRARILEERTNLLLQKLGQPQAPAQAAAPVAEAPKLADIPDVEKDALGAIKALVQNFKVINETEAQRTAREAQETQQRQQYNERVVAERAIINHAAQAEREFVKETPDYNQATQFLQQTRFNALMAIPGMDQATAIQTMQTEGLQLAARAVQNGQNPAQVIYNIAKAHGYKAAAPVAAAPAVQPPTAQERLANVARGQEHARSLGNTGGAAPKPQLTAQKLATMSEKDFAAFLDQASPAQMREVFGS